MEKINLEAIVLKTWDYGDNDLIVSLLSRERGRVQAIAKGAKASRRRFLGSLDLFCHASFLVREKKHQELLLLEEARLIGGFFKIRQDYDSILLASGLLDFCHKFCQPGLTGFFEVLKTGLERVESGGAHPSLYWNFLMQSLHQAGLLSSLDRCVRCQQGEKPPFFFEIEAGGLVCQNCQPGSGALEWSPDFLSDESFSSQLGWVLERHLLYQTGHQLEWKRFLVNI